MKTKEEIQSLIDGKIKGQGSAVDVGGALPEILSELNEIANDAVGPNSTDLDEETQMQVRKNLGLYYEETTEEEKTAQYTDQPATQYGTVKLSDDVPEPEDIVDVLYEGEHVDYVVTDKAYGGYFVAIPNYGPGIMQDMMFEVRETPQNPTHPSAGIWFTTGSYDNPEKYTLVYKASETTISKVPAKYLPDIPDDVEGNPTVPGGTSPTPLENLRIGEEYFSIPQSGGGTPVTLLSIPTNGQSKAASAVISSDDLAALVAGDANTAIYSGKTYFVVRGGSVIGYTSTLVFYGAKGAEFVIGVRDNNPQALPLQFNLEWDSFNVTVIGGDAETMSDVSALFPALYQITYTDNDVQRTSMIANGSQYFGYATSLNHTFPTPVLVTLVYDWEQEKWTLGKKTWTLSDLV